VSQYREVEQVALEGVGHGMIERAKELLARSSLSLHTPS